MPRIELILPGEPKTHVEAVAGAYRITVERDDGIACSDMEARTALGMICVHATIEQKSKQRRAMTRTNPSMEGK